MTIEKTEKGWRIIAAEGKALRLIGDTKLSCIVSKDIPESEDPNKWEDCDIDDGSTEEIMRYSVRSIIRELKAINKFDAVRSLLEAANYDWDFIGSNYLSSDDADFQTMMAAIVSQGILTQAELDTLLPKCIWEQTPMV